MEKELTVEDNAYSVKLGSILGFLVGWAIGVALLLYLNSKDLNQWPGVASIPIWNGIGWGLYGFIAGSGGLFAHIGRKPEAERTASEQSIQHAA